MPHLTLRHSGNLAEINFIPFFQKAHEILCNTIQVRPSSCSSMVTPYQQYLFGDGESDIVFVHLDVLVKAGKNPESLNQVSQNLLTVLSDYLISKNIAKIKVSVHVFETSYFAS